MYDDRDRRILAQLRKDARAKLVDIAEATDIPVSTVHERVNKLMQQVRLVSIPDYRQLRVPLVCWGVVQAKDRDEMREALQSHPSVNTLLAVNNGADFVCECVFPGFAEQHRFQDEIDGLGRVTFYPLIQEVGREVAPVRKA